MAKASHVAADDTKDMVELLADGGIPKRAIAKAMPAIIGVLNSHCADQLEHRAKMVNANAVRRLFRLIEEGSTPATTSWLKGRVGWKDGQTVLVEEKTPRKTYGCGTLSRDEDEALRKSLSLVERGQAQERLWPRTIFRVLRLQRLQAASKNRADLT